MNERRANEIWWGRERVREHREWSGELRGMVFSFACFILLLDNSFYKQVLLVEILFFFYFNVSLCIAKREKRDVFLPRGHECIFSQMHNFLANFNHSFRFRWPWPGKLQNYIEN
jgi:hypothetical protein